MTSLLKYTQLELRKLLRLPSLHWSLVIISLFVILVNLFPLLSQSTDRGWAGTLSGSMLAMTVVGNLCMIVVAAQFVASEYTNRTLQLVVAAGVSRSTILAAKCLTLVIGLYGVTLTGALLSLALAAGVGGGMGQFSIGDLNLPAFLLSLVLLPLRTLPYMFLAILLAIMLRSAVMPTALMIAFATIGETALAIGLTLTRLADAASYLPGRLVSAVDNATIYHLSNSPDEAFVALRQAAEALNQSLPVSLLLMVSYAAGLACAAYLIFRHQNLSR